MDSTLVTGGRASTLSTPQKALSVLLSIILVVGLSPFGQNPQRAYAADGKASGQLQTQAAGDGFQVNVTEDVMPYNGTDYANTSLSKGKDGKVTVDDLNAIAYGSLDKDAETGVADSLLLGEDKAVAKAKIKVWVKRGAFGENIPAADTQLDPTKAASDDKSLWKYFASYAYVKGGKVVKNVTETGDYALRLYGTGINEGQYFDTPFSISKLNISAADATVAATPSETLTYTGDWQAVKFASVTVTSKSQGAENVEIPAASYDISPSTVKARGNNTVTLTAKQGDKNLTGSATASVNVGRAKFTATGLVSVAGTVNTNTNKDAETTSQIEIKKALDPADADPAADGKVKFGATTLTRGTASSPADYTVAYAGDGIDGTTETAPAVAGSYTATITATNTDFILTGDHVLTVSYKVSGTSLTSVADSAALGAVTYLAPNGGLPTFNDEGEKVVDGGGNYVLTPNTVVVLPASVTFSKDGKDVTSAVGENYSFGKAVKWTAADEKRLLGEAKYKELYPYADEPYKNDSVADDFEADYADASHGEYVPQTHGYQNMTAGAYKVTLAGDGELAGGEITAKLEVQPNTPAEGTAVGQLVVTAGKSSINEEAAEVTAGDEVAVKMVTYKQGRSYEYSNPLEPGDEADVEGGEADYYVTYEKDGKPVKAFAESGEYDAVLHFGANFGGKTLTVAKGMVVGKANLASYLASEGVENVIVYADTPYYTGKPAKLTARFFKGIPEDSQETLGEITETADKCDALAERGLEVEVDPAAYAVKAAATGSEDTIALSGGLPLGPGAYTAYLEGAGDYEGSVKGSADNVSVEGSVTIAPFDISGPFTVQFKDGSNWVEDYATALVDGKAEPAFRLVTTVSKDDAEPVEVTGLFTSKYENNTAAQSAASVKLTAAESAGYVVKGSKSWGFSVAKGTFDDAKVALTLAEKTAAYDGAAHDLDVTVGVAGANPLQMQTKDTDKGDYVLTVRNAKGTVVYKSTATGDEGYAGIVDAGKYTVSVTGGQSLLYAGTLEDTYEVTPIEVKQSDVYDKDNNAKGKLAIAVDEGLQYDGSKQKAIERVTYKLSNGSNEELVNTADKPSATGGLYTVEGDEKVDAGNYTATITFSGNYTGSVTQDFKVKPQDISKLKLKVGDKDLLSSKDTTSPNVYEVDYNGKAQEPEVKLFSNGVEVEGVEATFLYEGNVNAGKLNTADDTTKAKHPYLASAKVTVIGSNSNYTGRTTGYFTINGYDITSDRVAVTFNEADLVETGAALDPVPTVTYTKKDGEVYTLKQGADFALEFSGDRTKAGDKGTVKIIGLEPNFMGGDTTFITRDFTVAANTRQDQAITIGAGAAVTKAAGSGAFALNATTTGDSTLEYASSDPVIATVDGFGNVTPLAQGKATITVTAPATVKFNAATATVELTVTAAEQPGQQQAQTIAASDISVAAGKTAAINAKASGNGILTYATSNPAVATVSATGMVTGVKAGTALITIEAGATATYAAATKLIVVTVTAAAAPAPAEKANPVKVTVAKKQFKAKSSKKTVLKAKKVFKVTGNKGGKVTFAKANKAGAKKIAVSKKGKVTVKKGLKAGVYKVKVKATAAAKGGYGAATRTVTVKVKVAKK